MENKGCQKWKIKGVKRVSKGCQKGVKVCSNDTPKEYIVYSMYPKGCQR